MFTLKTVTFNAWVGQSPTDLRENVEDLIDVLGSPHILSLQEVKRFKGTFPGYEPVRVPPTKRKHDTDISTQLFIREDLYIKKQGFLRVDGPMWHGPKHGTPQDPRVFPWAVVKLPGVKRAPLFMGIHRTPARNYRNNEHSWRAEHRDLKKFCNARRAVKPLCLLGDWNCRQDNQPWPDILDLTGTIRCTVALKGIDGTVYRGMEICEQRKLDDKYGSDSHRPVVTTFCL